MIKYRVQKFRTVLVKDGGLSVAAEKVMGAPEAEAVFRGLLEGLPHEEIWVVLLDLQLRVKGAARVAQGGHTSAAVAPFDVLRPVIAGGCSYFVLGHNHPSGSTEPSREDIEMTRRLIRAADVVGLHLLDHVIVAADGGARSLRVDCRELADDWNGGR